MTIKIKAERAWEYPNGRVSKRSHLRGEWRVRIVRESDWRKLMKLVRAAEIHSCFEHDSEVYDALNALEKKK
jgi:hypothetical protein